MSDLIEIVSNVIGGRPINRSIKIKRTALRIEVNVKTKIKEN